MGRSADRFKAKLESLIHSKIITITELHEKTGIGRNSIYGYLEKAVPDLDTLDKIADALDVDPATLICDDRPISRDELDAEQLISRLRRVLHVEREMKKQELSEKEHDLKKKK